MNSVLANLLTNSAAVDTLRAGLPLAFEMAAVEASRVTLNRRTGLAHSTTGQEVGGLRERVILGYLFSQLGEANVQLPAPGAPMVDATVARQPLEIKTVTGRGSLRRSGHQIMNQSIKCWRRLSSFRRGLFSKHVPLSSNRSFSLVPLRHRSMSTLP